MSASLTPKAKALLLEQNAKLMFDDRAATNAVAAVKEILRWCDNEDIIPGKWLINEKKYRFNRQGIEKIRQAYLSTMSEDIFDDFSQDDHQTASVKTPNEKLGGVKPTHHLILAAITENTCFEGFQSEFYASPQINVELNIYETDFSNYDSLIIIENRDSFNDWHLFQIQVEDALGKVLALYRGDSHYAVAATSLLKHWRDIHPERAVVYFGDFDLSGLMLAVSAKCTHLLLPSHEFIKANVISQHYPDDQLKYLAGLEVTCPSGWQLLLSLMSSHRAGLRQQRMYNTPLVLYKS